MTYEEDCSHQQSFVTLALPFRSLPTVVGSEWSQGVGGKTVQVLGRMDAT